MLTAVVWCCFWWNLRNSKCFITLVAITFFSLRGVFQRFPCTLSESNSNVRLYANNSCYVMVTVNLLLWSRQTETCTVYGKFYANISTLMSIGKWYLEPSVHMKELVKPCDLWMPVGRYTIFSLWTTVVLGCRLKLEDYSLMCSWFSALNALVK